MNLSITMDLSDFNSDTEECWQVLQEGIENVTALVIVVT